MKVTSAESKAVLRGRARPVRRRELDVGQRVQNLGEPEQRRQLAQVSLGDVSFAAAVKAPDIAAQSVELDPGARYCRGRIAGLKSCARIPEAEHPGSTGRVIVAAWRPG